MKINEGFWPKPQISTIRKNYLEFGLKYKEIQVNGYNMAKNVPSGGKDIENCSRDLKYMSQNPDLRGYLMVPQEIYFMKKSRKTCKHWWDIGEKWRKMAQVG